MSLPLRQRWAQEFIDQAEQRMSAKRKGRYHRIVVRHVWRQLNGGKPYVTEAEVVAHIRAVVRRQRTRSRRSPRADSDAMKVRVLAPVPRRL